MALLELYPDTSRCAEVCLHVCNELSRQLVEDPRSLDHYLMIRFGEFALCFMLICVFDIGLGMFGALQ
jgi:hypothetical protein